MSNTKEDQMAVKNANSREKKMNFSEDFFELEEISCEKEQEDSAKTASKADSTKGSLERQQSRAMSMMKLAFVVEHV